MTPLYIAMFSDSIIYLSMIFIPFYLWGNNRKELALYVVCLASTLFAVYFLKIVIAFPRPSFAMIPMPPTHSFPSMHAALGMLPVGFFFYLKKWRIPLLAYGILIACSRVILGVHYWADIVAGAALGLAIPLLVFYRKEIIFRTLKLKTK